MLTHKGEPVFSFDNADAIIDSVFNVEIVAWKMEDGSVLSADFKPDFGMTFHNSPEDFARACFQEEEELQKALAHEENEISEEFLEAMRKISSRDQNRLF